MPIIDMKSASISPFAVLIDATIVAAHAPAATMKLFGGWNWCLPKWLDELPGLEHEQSAMLRSTRSRRGRRVAVHRRAEPAPVSPERGAGRHVSMK